MLLVDNEGLLINLLSSCTASDWVKMSVYKVSYLLDYHCKCPKVIGTWFAVYSCFEEPVLDP